MPSGRAEEFRRIAAKLGFIRDRQRGSHELWVHPDGRTVTVPRHGATDIGGGLFYKILGQLGIDLATFNRLR